MQVEESESEHLSHCMEEKDDWKSVDFTESMNEGVTTSASIHKEKLWERCSIRRESMPSLHTREDLYFSWCIDQGSLINNGSRSPFPEIAY